MSKRLATPGTLELGEALDQNAALGRLMQRLRESQQRFQAIEACIPKPLAAAVKAGPLDEQGWTLLAAHGSAAAKLRQLVPLFEQALLQSGWTALAIRIKLHSD